MFNCLSRNLPWATTLVDRHVLFTVLEESSCSCWRYFEAFSGLPDRKTPLHQVYSQLGGFLRYRFHVLWECWGRWKESENAIKMRSYNNRFRENDVLEKLCSIFNEGTKLSQWLTIFESWFLNNHACQWSPPLHMSITLILHPHSKSIEQWTHLWWSNCTKKKKLENIETVLSLTVFGVCILGSELNVRWSRQMRVKEWHGRSSLWAVACACVVCESI